MRAIIASVVSVIAVTSVCQAQSSPPEGYKQIRAATETVAISGQPVQLSYELYLKTSFQQGSATFLLWATGSLSDLQAKAPSLVGGQKAFDECGDRLEVYNVSLAPSGDRARLCGSVTYERWECVKMDVPEFRGLEVRMETKIVAKTRLLSQSGDICAAFWPQVGADGRSIAMAGDITDVNLSGLLGGVADAFGLKGTFKDLIRGELENALADASLVLPAEIVPFNPKLTEVRFETRQDGTLGIIAQGEAVVSEDAVPQLVQLLSQQ